MAFTTELDVINDMLATLGEAPLNQLTDDHSMVAPGRRQLAFTSYREQAKGWWFNKETVVLTPDLNDKSLYVPQDTIGIDPSNPFTNYVQRGRRLYDPQKTSFQFDDPVTCKLVRLIPFEDLPASAAVYISLSAVLAFQKNYDGDPQKTRLLMIDLSNALAQLNSENIRNRNVNLLDRASTSVALSRLGYSPQLGGIRN